MKENKKNFHNPHRESGIILSYKYKKDNVYDDDDSDENKEHEQ